MAVVLTAGLCGGACVEPQSGAVTKTWCSTADAIDDMEDGDGSLCSSRGAWAVGRSGDEITTTPSAGAKAAPSDIPVESLAVARMASSRAMKLHVGGAVATGRWGELLAKFESPRDLGGYTSLRFWMWGERDESIRMRVNVAAGSTLAAGAGGACNAPPGMCDDHFGAEIRGAFPAWTEQTVNLGGLIQEGWGAPGVKDLTDARSVIFRVESIAGFSNPDPVDIWIDDLEVVP